MIDDDPHTSSQLEVALRGSNRFLPGPLRRFLNGICPPLPHLSMLERMNLAGRFATISRNVPCAHEQTEVLSFVHAVFALPTSVEGCIIEAGAYKGGSTAKFSIVAKLTGRQLCVFDSFEGLPEHEEAHDKSVLGHSLEGWFEAGGFHGSLEEVKANVERFGHIEVCSFFQGYFENTMPAFTAKIAAAYLDVDLASSTKTCLKHLYPRLSPGGLLMSQDGDLPPVIEVFDDDRFWEGEVGCAKPPIDGLGTRKILTILS